MDMFSERASVESRLVLPFLYWLTRVVPDKGPLNGRVCVCVCVLVERMPRKYQQLLRWRMSQMTPIVVKLCIARTGFRATASK